jgi:hypothetical protein
MTLGNATYQTTATINAANSIALKIDSSSILSVTSSAITTTGLLLDSNGHSAAGHGDSYHISNVGATEVRGLVIHPLDVGTDSGTDAICVDAGTSGTSLADPALVAASQRTFSLGSRGEQSYMQLYNKLGPIPAGWKAVAITVYISDKSDGSQKSTRIAVASRSIFNSPSIGSNTSDFITSHLSLINAHTANVLRPFSVAFVQTPASPRNLYLYIGSQSADAVFVGGELRIERV